MTTSEHAHKRMKQRGISSECIDLLMTFGSVSPAPGNAYFCELDKNGKKRLKKALSHGKQLLDKMSGHAAIISGDGQIITCYHSYKK